MSSFFHPGWWAPGGEDQADAGIATMHLGGQPELASAQQIVLLEGLSACAGHLPAGIRLQGKVAVQRIVGIVGEDFAPQQVGPQALFAEQGVEHFLALGKDEHVVGPVGFSHAESVDGLSGSIPKKTDGGW